MLALQEAGAPGVPFSAWQAVAGRGRVPLRGRVPPTEGVTAVESIIGHVGGQTVVRPPSGTGPLDTLDTVPRLASRPKSAQFF